MTNNKHSIVTQEHKDILDTANLMIDVMRNECKLAYAYISPLECAIGSNNDVYMLEEMQGAMIDILVCKLNQGIDITQDQTAVVLRWKLNELIDNRDDVRYISTDIKTALTFLTNSKA